MLALIFTSLWWRMAQSIRCRAGQHRWRRQPWQATFHGQRSVLVACTHCSATGYEIVPIPRRDLAVGA